MEIYGAKIGKPKRRILIVCNSGLWMLLSKFARVATSEDPALSLVETEVDPFESCRSYSVEVDEPVCLSLNDELECNAPTGHLEREREREREKYRNDMAGKYRQIMENRDSNESQHI